MKNIINLTPHEIVVINNNNKISFPPSGKIARINTNIIQVGEIDGIPLFQSEMTTVTGLPDPSVDTWYIVSMAIRSAMPNRKDILSPGELIRNDNGQPIGCNGFNCN